MFPTHLGEAAATAPSPGPKQRLTCLHRHLGLWVLQGWLAMFYSAAGYAKLSQPHETLGLLMTWPEMVEASWVAWVGVLEVSLALGMLLPLFSWAWFRVPLLICASLIVAVAVVMAVFHATQGQFGLVLVNAILSTMALCVIGGRRSVHK